ncbi:hypothetical protein C8J57DRAFT_1072214 [Mycena rebaudengoi]|nr:hypothetical protein C8J57DRAFT_1090981 [Mycena rebaudengoi]KAJ7260781.1 hypothetical protein C8J57DRAFT_1072214 [Mycena rebaudengoi]
MEFSTRSDLNRPHFKRVNRSCTVCKADRNTGCCRPFRYHEEALALLDCLHPKWDPRRILHQPNPDLNLEEQAENISALDKKNPVTFDSNITVKSDLSLAFRALQAMIYTFKRKRWHQNSMTSE